jgi:hypothetical protein
MDPAVAAARTGLAVVMVAALILLASIAFGLVASWLISRRRSRAVQSYAVDTADVQGASRVPQDIETLECRTLEAA